MHVFCIHPAGGSIALCHVLPSRRSLLSQIKSAHTCRLTAFPESAGKEVVRTGSANLSVLPWMDFLRAVSIVSNSFWIKSSIADFTGSQFTVKQSTFSTLHPHTHTEKEWSYFIKSVTGNGRWCYLTQCVCVYLGRRSTSFPFALRALKFLSQSCTVRRCFSTRTSISTCPKTTHSCKHTHTHNFTIYYQKHLP